MPRIVSVWLERWPISRLRASRDRGGGGEPAEAAPPLVLAVTTTGGQRVFALDEQAEALGVARGDGLADARAKAVRLQVRPADPQADRAGLRGLAVWSTRYTPVVASFDEASGADGLFLDVTGSAHLFGGEAALLADLAGRLDRFGLPARLAVAGTAGAAWALAHYGRDRIAALPSGQEAAALAGLPIAALRLSDDSCARLRRLGLHRIGDLLDKPRPPLAARFGAQLLTRLDQALGRAAEPLPTLAPPPAYTALRPLTEPIATQEAVIALAAELMGELEPLLEGDGCGARSLRLLLYRLDGAATALDLALAAPTRSVSHVARLLRLKLERVGDGLDPGFGFEALRLDVSRAEPLPQRQADFDGAAATARRDRRTSLLDALRQRLGARRVRRLLLRESHVPERAAAEAMAGGDEGAAWAMAEEEPLRPPLLLPSAEPAEVMALVPEGPPLRFRWRRVLHRVVHAQGPERIACEWWREGAAAPTRDYYLVEDEAGRRFWLYREGILGRETSAPSWFVHGLFA